MLRFLRQFTVGLLSLLWVLGLLSWSSEADIPKPCSCDLLSERFRSFAPSSFDSGRAADWRITLTNRDKNVWTFPFDGANHLTNTVSPTGRNTFQTWNNRGLPSSVVQPSGHTTTVTYDTMDRQSTRADLVGTTTLQYDLDSNVTNVVQSGVSLTSTLDAYNRVVQYVDGSGNMFQYQYDANSNLTNLIYPGGNKVFYLYDSLSRLTNVVDWAGRKTFYTYDLASHVTSVTRPNGTVRVINYDAAGQTTSILEETSAGNGIAYFQFTNDLSGRIQSEFIAPIPHPYSLPTRTMTYDADDRLATVGGTSVTDTGTVFPGTDLRVIFQPLGANPIPPCHEV
jgi:YD repeat-containing protein